jgi:hypothetical protein
VKLLRSIASVIVGYGVFVVSAVALFQLSGREPHAPQPLWFMVASTAYGMAFAGLGGSLSARIAPSRPRLHAGITALFLAAGATVSLIKSPPADATWSMWGAILLMAPACCLAGFLVPRK